MPEQTHFTAVVEIVKSAPQPSMSTRDADRGKVPERNKTEIARIVVRGEDLKDLKTRLNAHIELVEDY